MGYRLSKIYTRTGDQGTTGLADGSRVSKAHPRIEAIGEVDTVNSQLGLLLAHLTEDLVMWPGLNEIIVLLHECQHRLFEIGGELAMPGYEGLTQADIELLEQKLDEWNQEVGPLEEFILPAGSIAIAQSHICRSSARCAERRCSLLHEQEPIRGELLGYINRLSDVFFVVARLIGKRQHINEVLWQPRT